MMRNSQAAACARRRASCTNSIAGSFAGVLFASLLSACGSGIPEVVIGSDSTDNTTGTPDDPSNSGNSGDDPNSGSGGQSGTGNPGVSLTGGQNPPSGQALIPMPGLEPVSVVMDCKFEDSDGTLTTERHELRYSPATVGFFVDNGRVFDGGFSWAPLSQEFVAVRSAPVGTATATYNAKINSSGSPTYYRYKLTLSDFSFEQVECYQGLTIAR